MTPDLLEEGAARLARHRALPGQINTESGGRDASTGRIAKIGAQTDIGRDLSSRLVRPLNPATAC